MLQTLSLCLSCKRSNGDGTCTAYPAVIPSAIQVHGADHREPMPGDQGLQYVRQEGEKAEELFNAWLEFHTVATG